MAGCNILLAVLLTLIMTTNQSMLYDPNETLIMIAGKVRVDWKKKVFVLLKLQLLQNR